jgi:hypothetical protein
LIRPNVDEVFQKTVNEPGRLAKSTQDLLDKAFGALEWAKRSNVERRKLDSIARSLDKGRAALKTLDVDIEGLHEDVARSLRDLDENTKSVLDGRVAAVRAQILEAESKKTSARYAVEHSRDEMKKTEGSKAWGCISSFVVFWGLCSIVGVARTLPVVRELVRFVLGQHSMIFSLSVLALSVVGYRVGVQLSQWEKNKSKRQEIEGNLRVSAKCEPLIIQLRQEESKANAELQPYLEWRRANGVE